ncbi:hypothetical protein KM043_001343 [Ampulex compressa]|nr:hypothetical protein KM043_001343 [Ampulex compressa]
MIDGGSNVVLRQTFLASGIRAEMPNKRGESCPREDPPSYGRGSTSRRASADETGAVPYEIARHETRIEKKPSTDPLPRVLSPFEEPRQDLVNGPKGGTRFNPFAGESREEGALSVWEVRKAVKPTCSIVPLRFYEDAFTKLVTSGSKELEKICETRELR